VTSRRVLKSCDKIACTKSNREPLGRPRSLQTERLREPLSALGKTGERASERLPVEPLHGLDDVERRGAASCEVAQTVDIAVGDLHDLLKLGWDDGSERLDDRAKRTGRLS
jgi:hypothetical protein